MLSTEGMDEVEIITDVRSADVLFGRGNRNIFHEGNCFLRELVRVRRDEYRLTCNYKEKDNIACEVVRAVQQRGGRFLKQVVSDVERRRYGIEAGTEAWICVNMALSVEKVKQNFRDAATPRKNQKQQQSTEPSLPRQPHEAAAVLSPSILDDSFVRLSPSHLERALALQQLQAQHQQQQQQQQQQALWLAREQLAKRKLLEQLQAAALVGNANQPPNCGASTNDAALSQLILQRQQEGMEVPYTQPLDTLSLLRMNQQNALSAAIAEQQLREARTLQSMQQLLGLYSTEQVGHQDPPRLPASQEPMTLASLYASNQEQNILDSMSQKKEKKNPEKTRTRKWKTSDHI
jgi:hypothetical protein